MRIRWPWQREKRKDRSSRTGKARRETSTEMDILGLRIRFYHEKEVELNLNDDRTVTYHQPAKVLWVNGILVATFVKGDDGCITAYCGPKQVFAHNGEPVGDKEFLGKPHKERSSGWPWDWEIHVNATPHGINTLNFVT